MRDIPHPDADRAPGAGGPAVRPAPEADAAGLVRAGQPALGHRGGAPTVLMPGPRSLEFLGPLLPANSLAFVADLLDRDDIHLRLTRPRRTKLGDHRPPGQGVRVHRISLNADLNPFALLTTLVHEVAHARAWERCGRRPRRPHGPEWQAAFALLLEPLVAGEILPVELRAALAESLARPRAATCSDRSLLLALSRYDRPVAGRVFAESLSEGVLFRIDDGTLFRAGPMVRTRRRCFLWPQGAEYRVHGLARVEPVSAEGAVTAAGGPISGSSYRTAARPTRGRPLPPGSPRRRRSRPSACRW